MSKARLEAFTDGVIAVIITIMVLEMKVPHSGEPGALAPLLPVFLSYVLSFVFVAIYWNNHHPMFHAAVNREMPYTQSREALGADFQELSAVSVC